jgi:hypothetical protein
MKEFWSLLVYEFSNEIQLSNFKVSSEIRSSSDMQNSVRSYVSIKMVQKTENKMSTLESFAYQSSGFRMVMDFDNSHL